MDRNILIAHSDGSYTIVGPLWRFIDQFLYDSWKQLVSTDLVGQWLTALFDVQDAEEPVETRLSTAEHDQATGTATCVIEMRTHAKIRTSTDVSPLFEFEDDNIFITGNVSYAFCFDCITERITVVTILVTTTPEYRKRFIDDE